MKNYMKPDVFVTEFQVNEAIAACTDTTEKKWKNQTIVCVVNGEETIFYDGCDNNADNGKLVEINGNATYAGGTYYVWYDGVVAGAPNNAQKEILEQCGISGPGWHAGPATSEIITVHNMS